MSTQAVEIQVLGRKLKVNCPTGQENALRAAAADFDQRLKDMSARSNVSVEQLLIFTGLNISNELHLERQEHNRNAELISNKINSIEENLDKVLQYQPKR